MKVLKSVAKRLHINTIHSNLYKTNIIYFYSVWYEKYRHLCVLPVRQKRSIVSSPLSIAIVFCVRELRRNCGSRSLKSSSGALILEPRTSILEPRSSNLDPRTSILEPQTSILDPQSFILDPFSSILHPRYSILRPWSSNLDPRSSILHPRSSLIESWIRRFTQYLPIEPRSMSVDDNSSWTLWHRSVSSPLSATEWRASTHQGDCISTCILIISQVRKSLPTNYIIVFIRIF